MTVGITSSSLSASQRLRTRAGALMLVVALLGLEAQAAGAQEGPTPAYAAVQTVSSSEGLYAWGMGGGELSEDSELWFSAFFSYPQGVEAASPPTGNLDLAMPVGWLELTERGPLIGENVHEMHELCNSAENVSSYDIGRRTDTGGPDRWTGLWFDVECEGELGYDYFRVHLNSESELREFLTADPDEPVTVDYDVDYGVSEEQAQGVTYSWADLYWYSLTRERLPEFTPVSLPTVANNVEHQPMYQYRQGWGGPTGQNDVGELVAVPLQQQVAKMTVCGHRDRREVRCYGRGGGDIFPATAGMTQTLHSP